MTAVLDASALLRYLDGENGAHRVAALLADHLAGRGQVTMSAVNWGEVAGVLARRFGQQTAETTMQRLAKLSIPVAPATTEQTERAAYLRVRLGIPYADAFGVELTRSLGPAATLITADFDVKPAASEIRIEFLPAKPAA